QLRGHQRAPALGISPRQRVVRGVQRAAGHVGRPVSGARQPRRHHQDQSLVQVLSSRVTVRDPPRKRPHDNYWPAGGRGGRFPLTSERLTPTHWPLRLTKTLESNQGQSAFGAWSPRPKPTFTS